MTSDEGLNPMQEFWKHLSKNQKKGRGEKRNKQTVRNLHKTRTCV